MGVEQRVTGIAHQVHTIRSGLGVVVIVELIAGQHRDPVGIAVDVDRRVVLDRQRVGCGGIEIAGHIRNCTAVELDRDVIECRRCDQHTITVALDLWGIVGIVIEGLRIRVDARVRRDPLQIGQRGVGHREVIDRQVIHGFREVNRDVKGRAGSAVVPGGSGGQRGAHVRSTVVQREDLVVDCCRQRSGGNISGLGRVLDAGCAGQLQAERAIGVGNARHAGLAGDGDRVGGGVDRRNTRDFSLRSQRTGDGEVIDADTAHPLAEYHLEGDGIVVGHIFVSDR